MAFDATASQTVTAPPRSSRAKGGNEPARRLPSKLAERREAVDGAFQLAGFALIVGRQYADAGALGIHGPAISRELVDLSDKNEKIAKALDYLTEAGPYAGLIVATMPLILQVMANHGIVKAEMVATGGVVPPAALESQVKADMARQAAEALRAQHEAEAQLSALAQEFAPQDGSEGSPEASNGKTPRRQRQAASQ